MFLTQTELLASFNHRGQPGLWYDGGGGAVGSRACGMKTNELNFSITGVGIHSPYLYSDYSLHCKFSSTTQILANYSETEQRETHNPFDVFGLIDCSSLDW